MANTVLNGVTIVDTRDGALTRDMTIVTDNGKIAKIGPAASVDESGAPHAIDARGKYVVPGYLDLHAHPLNSADPEGSLTLMLANGITGFRQMSGTPEALAARRTGTLMPSTYPAPELLEMAGQILTKANAATPEAAVAEVRLQKAQGADFIKVIDVSPATFHAVAAETKALGLRFLGHLNPDVPPAEAARAGMRSIEHLGPRDAILLSCSTDEIALRQLVAQQPSKPPPISGPVPEAVILRAIANPAMFTAPDEAARYARVIDTYSEAKLRDLAAELVAAGMWQVPTLIRIRTQMHGDDQMYRSDPNLRYVPAVMRTMWEELAQQFPTRLSPTARETLDRLFALLLKLVKPMKAAGVKMMAGSDSGGSAGWAIPGFSLHQEFDLLVEAGLSPLEILQMTTLNGAEFLGREASMGSVAVGKDANLVLLNADPMKSAQNLHGVSAVVRAGTYLSADALSAMKQRTGERVATLPPPTRPPGPSCC
jgi:hypothetical protein